VTIRVKVNQTQGGRIPTTFSRTNRSAQREANEMSRNRTVSDGLKLFIVALMIFLAFATWYLVCWLLMGYAWLMFYHPVAWALLLTAGLGIIRHTNKGKQRGNDKKPFE